MTVYMQKYISFIIETILKTDPVFIEYTCNFPGQPHDGGRAIKKLETLLYVFYRNSSILYSLCKPTLV